MQISIHALLAESDPPIREIIQWEGIFLSTLSLRRATNKKVKNTRSGLFLSTLSLRRATRKNLVNGIRLVFLSTLSLRRATLATWKPNYICRNFYPRSPCGERPGRIWSTAFAWYFYPRSPCGERPWQRGSRITYVEISIHALLAESDARRVLGFVDPDISIHALLAESDRARYMCPLCVKNFYPRSPCGERPEERHYRYVPLHFYPRSPCGERLA